VHVVKPYGLPSGFSGILFDGAGQTRGSRRPRAAAAEEPELAWPFAIQGPAAIRASVARMVCLDFIELAFSSRGFEESDLSYI
jgi:hypothetical protein